MRHDVEKSTHHILFSFFTATQIHPQTQAEKKEKEKKHLKREKTKKSFNRISFLYLWMTKGD